MAKGKITPYDVKSFSPAAVGVPNQSRAGEIIGRAFEKAGNSMIQQGREFKEQAEASDKLSAATKFGEFQLDYVKQKSALQQQYRDKPDEYPAALRTLHDTVSNSHRKDMSSGVGSKFRVLTTNDLVGETESAGNWVAQRKQEIGVGNIITINQNIALKAQGVQSASDLQAVLADFTNPEKEQASLQFISPETNMKLNEQYSKLAKENAMASQIYAQPMRVFRDLQGGGYKGVLSPEEITIYTEKARQAMRNKSEDDYYRSQYTAQGEILDLQQRADSGELTPTELIARKNAALANRDQKDANGNLYIDEGYLKSLDNLIDQTLHSGARPTQLQKDQREAALNKFDTKWAEFLTENRYKTPNVSNIKDELAIYADLSEMYKTGLIDKSDFSARVNIMRTKLALRTTGVATVKSFDQAIQEAGVNNGGWFRDKSNDVYTYGYKYIKDFINKSHSGLSVADKFELETQMLSEYTKQVQATPEATLKDLDTENKRQVFAHNIIVGRIGEKGAAVPGILTAYSFYRDPVAQKNLFVGDRITRNGAEQVFMGLHPQTGAPMFKFVEGQVITNGNGERAKVLPDGNFEVMPNG